MLLRHQLFLLVLLPLPPFPPPSPPRVAKGIGALSGIQALHLVRISASEPLSEQAGVLAAGCNAKEDRMCVAILHVDSALRQGRGGFRLQPASEADGTRQAHPHHGLGRLHAPLRGIPSSH
jgi:hypothetical protein